MPGERAGAAKLTIYTSEGNNYSSAGFARRFAPEVAQRVNVMLGEARRELVLSSAAGSQRNLETLHSALADLHHGATELNSGLNKARHGSSQLAGGNNAAAEAAQRLRAGAAHLADSAPALAGGLRQVAPLLRGLDARRPSDADLALLRQGARQATEGQRELGNGLSALTQGSRQLDEGLVRFKAALDDVPLFGSRLIEGMAPLEDGNSQLTAGLHSARENSLKLLAGMQRIDEAVVNLTDATQRAGNAMAQLAARLPEEPRLDSFVEGARELSRGSDTLLVALRQLASGGDTWQSGTGRLADGAARLETGLELLRRSLPLAVDTPAGSAQGLALSVEPIIEVVAPVPNNGIALTPNFVPLALWVGAVMAAFLVHLQRIAEPLAALPRSAQVAGKLALPLLAVVLQALLMLLMLVAVLHVPLPIELSDDAFQALHPYLPLTWVVNAFRASLFGAFDGAFWPALGHVAAFGAGALLLGTLVGRWRAVPISEWKPPLDIE